MHEVGLDMRTTNPLMNEHRFRASRFYQLPSPARFAAAGFCVLGRTP